MKLAPKALAVLRQLVQQAGQVVSKEELFQTVWADTVVSDAALTFCIQELRRALRDDAKEPRYIETVHRRGFRFIAPLTTAPPVSSFKFQVSNSRTEPTPNPQSLTPSFVGRDTELTQLHAWLAKALQGERQLVFVTGEPGIGKTALVEAFRQRLETGDWRRAPSSQVSSPQPQVPIFIGHGQCIEHYGTGEPYLPLLDALGRLCREPDGQRIRAILAQYAPTWLVQMPSLLTTDEFAALQNKTAGATRTRMLRELAEAIEAVTAERPLVLVLEDLHWSDVSTLDWLVFIARRREAARLLVFGTYRPVEVLAREHPLKTVKHELHLHGQCQELAVDFLREDHVAEYLVRRFAVGAQDRAPFHRLARAIHQRTDGNPLFMVNVVDELIARGVFVQVDGQWTVQKEEDAVGAVPENLRQMIEQQVERLSAEERRVLEAASVASVGFSAAVVAAGVGTEPDAVEEHCRGLARREQFLRLAGTKEWPDGTVAARYGFLHALYQEVLYEQLPAGRRQRLHQQIGEREEQGYGDRAREIATELAIHFEQGRDYRRAVRYLQFAGENAIRRSANQEAIVHLTKGLQLFHTFPNPSQESQSELHLQLLLGTAHFLRNGFSAPEVSKAYNRAHELCQRHDDAPELTAALLGLWRFHMGQADYATAHRLGERVLSIAHRSSNSAVLVSGSYMLGCCLSYLGEEQLARTYLEKGIRYSSLLTQFPPELCSGFDPRVACYGFLAPVLWLLGYPDQALIRRQEMFSLAEDLAHPFTQVFAILWSALLFVYRREAQTAQKWVDQAMKLCRDHGYASLHDWATLISGWTLVEQGKGKAGIAALQEGLAILSTHGAEALWTAWQGLLIQAYLTERLYEAGLTAVAEGLATVERNAERFWESELYRLKGELTLQLKVESHKSQVASPQHLTPSIDAEAEAEACFHKAVDIAQKQQAKSWELRATTSLARLWRQQGKVKQAHKMLSDIYNWFTEGFDTKDLQEAKVLLAELGEN